MAAIVTRTIEHAHRSAAGGFHQEFWHVDMNAAATAELATHLTRIYGVGAFAIGTGGDANALSYDEVVGTTNGFGTASGNITIDSTASGTGGEYFVTVSGY